MYGQLAKIHVENQMTPRKLVIKLSPISDLLELKKKINQWNTYPNLFFYTHKYFFLKISPETRFVPPCHIKFLMEYL